MRSAFNDVGVLFFLSPASFFHFSYYQDGPCFPPSYECLDRYCTLHYIYSSSGCLIPDLVHGCELCKGNCRQYLDMSMVECPVYHCDPRDNPLAPALNATLASLTLVTHACFGLGAAVALLTVFWLATCFFYWRSTR